MAELATSLLWFIFWVIIIAGVIALVLYGIKTFVYSAFPPKLEAGIWFLYLILCLIYAIAIFAGGGGGLHFPTFR